MKLFPAIDLLDGKAVRLEEGKRDRATIFHDDPVQLVAQLAHDGADRLHVVDLNGAFGEPRQADLVRAIVAASPIPVEVGGGIRDRAAFEEVLAMGAAFVVLGTAAVKSPALVEELCRAYPGTVIVAVDARDGIVAVDGWTASSNISAVDLGLRAASWGAAALLYTDIARDGLRHGPNVAATSQLAHALSNVTQASFLEASASGEVRVLEVSGASGVEANASGVRAHEGVVGDGGSALGATGADAGRSAIGAADGRGAIGAAGAGDGRGAVDGRGAIGTAGAADGRGAIEVIASGGVGELDDIARLRDANIYAVVVGRAIYDKRFTVADAARVAHAIAHGIPRGPVR
jgi:phosphoribosylformimino-5-aminoimidazole carboxamide ribotide isomerase